MGSGHTLDEVLDMTFDQIQLSAYCITKVKIDFLNGLVEPIMGAMGVDYKPASTDQGNKPKKKKSKRASMSDEDKVTMENNKLLGLASMGIPVL